MNSLPPSVQTVAQDAVGWWPIRHHSPGCAWHLQRYLAQRRPAAILIEGPPAISQVMPLLQQLQTQPPVLVRLSNGTESASMPLCAFDPEWVALRAAAQHGAEVIWCDEATLGQPSGMPSDFGVAFVGASGRGTFDDAYDAWFEADAARVSTEVYRLRLLTLAALIRTAPSAADASRERAMAQAVRLACERLGAERVVVVLGAFHLLGVALVEGTPRSKLKRAGGNVHPQVHASVVPVSAQLLSARGVTVPAWRQACFSGYQGGPDPVVCTLVEVARRLSAAGLAVGTADAVSAVQVAHGLAALRGGGVASGDVAEAAVNAYGKGNPEVVRAVVDEVLVGTARGSLADGTSPELVAAFWAEVRALQVPLGDAPREARCDLRVEKQRRRSAFLHQCRFLKLPIFAPIGEGSACFRPAAPTTERWGLLRGATLDERLDELAAAASDLAQAALADLLAGEGLPVDALAFLLRDALQMGLDARFEPAVGELLVRLRGAFGTPFGLSRWVAALSALNEVRHIHPRREVDLQPVFAELFERALAALAATMLGQQHTANAHAMVTLSTMAPDLPGRRRWEHALGRLFADPSAPWLLRGTAAGLLSANGGLSEAALSEAAAEALSHPQGFPWLSGVLAVRRLDIVLGSELLGPVDHALQSLDGPQFLAALPELRRAFLIFSPSETERIAGAVFARILPQSSVGRDTPLEASKAAALRALDARILQLVVG